ncbi:MAG: glycosyltransferase family 4 protein [Acidobacteria bacterium]|nr:glycosyltransferase family 4 protein [Acidobacteriota bacterium]
MSCDTVGGVWTYAIDLARALSRHGIEVHLAAMGGLPSDSQRRQVRALRGVKLHESRFRLEWMDDPWRDLERAGEWLLDLADEVQPELVHLNHYAHGHLAWGVPSIVVGHSCVLSWWEAVHREPAPRAWDRYREVVARGLRGTLAVAAPTAAMLGELERHYGPLPHSRVIPNGRASRPGAIAVKEPIVFAAGRVWDEAKNLVTLDRVAGEIPWAVNIAGDPRHPSGATVELKRAHSLGLLGAEEVFRWYARAAIYALPARYEPFGLSVLEAAQAGCVLVLGDIPSLREVWGDAAVYVGPQDMRGLAATLNGLIQDGQRRAELATRARRRADRFTPERMALSYLALYRDAIAAHRDGVAVREAS